MLCEGILAPRLGITAPRQAILASKRNSGPKARHLAPDRMHLVGSKLYKKIQGIINCTGHQHSNKSHHSSPVFPTAIPSQSYHHLIMILIKANVLLALLAGSALAIPAKEPTSAHNTEEPGMGDAKASWSSCRRIAQITKLDTLIG